MGNGRTYCVYILSAVASRTFLDDATENGARLASPVDR